MNFMKTRYVPRFSLAALLIAALILGAGGGSAVRVWYGWPVYKKISGGIMSGRAFVCWRTANRKTELQYLVLIGDGYQPYTSTSSHGRNFPISDGIAMCDTALYVNRVPVEFKDGQRCFVYGHRDQMIPVPIPEKELQKINAGNIKQFAETQVWKDHIQPIIDAERAAFEKVEAARAVERRQVRSAKEKAAIERHLERMRELHIDVTAGPFGPARKETP